MRTTATAFSFTPGNRASLATAPHPALALFDAGYVDLLPVIPPGAKLSPRSRLGPNALGKIPGELGPEGWHGLHDWTHLQLSREQLEHHISTGASIGLRTARFPTIDVDISEPTLAAAVEDVLISTIGDGQPILKRIGDSPKFAVPCRTDEPFGKARLILHAKDGSKHGVIEILGRGQQFVVNGVHPKTGQSYTWRRGGEHGSAELLAATSPDALPALTLARSTDEILPALTQRLATCSIQIVQHGTGISLAGPVPDQESLRAPSPERLREAVARIPNGTNHHEYVQMCAAIRAAAGSEHEADGFDLFQEFASRWTGGHDGPTAIEATWNSIHPPYRLGWSYIEDVARGHGLNTAQDAFKADPAALPPSDITPLPTEGERIAAILRQAARPFFLDLPAIADGEILERWDAMQAAANHGDPLEDFFRTTVVSVAKTIAADEPSQFEIVLDALLRRNIVEWRRMDIADRHLLSRTAYTLFARLSKLSERLSDSPGLPLPIGQVERDYLVDGLIPGKSLASFVGAPAQGKTFAALELSAKIAKVPAVDQTETFAGRRVRHGSVLYFTSEDTDGLRARAATWAEANCPDGATGLRHLHLFGRVPPLSALDRTIGFVLAAVESVLSPETPPLRLIVIDVLRAAIEGEENSSDVVGAAMVAASTIGRMTGGSVLLLHHTALSEPERGRGSSAFTAAQDFIGVVTQSDRGITLKVTKNKSGPSGQTFTWHLDNGVLRDGATAAQTGDYSGEKGALAAGWAIREIARDDMPVTRQALTAEMTISHLELFGEHVLPKTVKTRLHRAIKHAVERGWIAMRRGKYIPGSVDPPELEDLSLSPANVEALL